MYVRTYVHVPAYVCKHVHSHTYVRDQDERDQDQSDQDEHDHDEHDHDEHDPGDEGEAPESEQSGLEDQDSKLLLVRSMVDNRETDMEKFGGGLDTDMEGFTHLVKVGTDNAPSWVIRAGPGSQHKLVATEKVEQYGIPEGLPEWTSIWRRHMGSAVERWRCRYPHPDVHKVRSCDNHTESGPGSYGRVVAWLIETHKAVQALGR